MKPTKGVRNGFPHENCLHAAQGCPLGDCLWDLCSRCRTSSDHHLQDVQADSPRLDEDDDPEARCFTQAVSSEKESPNHGFSFFSHIKHRI